MERVEEALRWARSGALEAAFDDLRGLGDDALPAMREGYRLEADPAVCLVLVEAIRQHRHPSVIPFLAILLENPIAEFWKQALDGLVSLASPESLGVLQVAQAGECHANRRGWIEEAIEQVTLALEQQAPARLENP